jgi:hypothetical protein
MSEASDPDDQDGAALGHLLTDLADDPDAPPSAVSPLSVIAAAKGGDREGGPTSALPAVPPPSAVSSSTSVSTTASQPAAQASVGELHVLTARQDAERRARRRRTTLIAGLAAACGVGVAAIVIPLTLSSSGGTTSADAPAAATSAASALAEGGGPAAAAPQSDTEAEAGAGGADQGEARTTPSATIDPSDPDANRPAPGEGALTETLPVPGEGVAPTDGSAPGGGVATSCWPALSEASSAALVGALPPDSFGAPGLLGLGCPAEPVAGASLTGTTPDTQLVVRVTRAEPGACAQSSSETGAGCVARGGDQYVSNDEGNLSVYAYGNGYQVEVGGRPATGIAPIPSGLSADQLSSAAAAVLASLG